MLCAWSISMFIQYTSLKQVKSRPTEQISSVVLHCMKFILTQREVSDPIFLDPAEISKCRLKINISSLREFNKILELEFFIILCNRKDKQKWLMHSNYCPRTITSASAWREFDRVSVDTRCATYVPVFQSCPSTVLYSVPMSAYSSRSWGSMHFLLALPSQKRHAICNLLDHESVWWSQTPQNSGAHDTGEGTCHNVISCWQLTQETKVNFARKHKLLYFMMRRICVEIIWRHHFKIVDHILHSPCQAQIVHHWRILTDFPDVSAYYCSQYILVWRNLSLCHTHFMITISKSAFVLRSCRAYFSCALLIFSISHV